ncbi:MAG: DeoR/GlpR transcriptional regulator [Desulfobulbaceae bacterium]|nr:DeoR/GlpR transcriptional regulator [Desulfobulbaceae bacterium]
MGATETLLPAQRRQIIFEIIKENYTARSSQLSEQLKVSEMTIRRDLAELERQGMVKRTHGGAVFHHERMTDKFKYQSSKEVNPEEKEKIARKAVELIQPHDVIFIGEGTTPSLILSHVDPGLPFTVFTNNHGIAAEIGNTPMSAELIFLGGVYNPVTYSTAGNYTLEMIDRINANKVFLGVDAFSLRMGLTTRNSEFAAIDRAMIRHTTGQVIAMSDHTKFGLVAALEVAKAREIDVLVTNFKMSQSFYNDLESLGIEVVLA